MKKLFIGVAIFGLAFLIGGIIFMDTGIALCIACVALVLTPPAYDPAIIIKTRQWLAGTHPESPKSWISWYRPPFRDYREYLAEAGDGEGYIYVRDRERAHQFPTYDEAMLKTPKYDGSDNIGNRAGVEPS